MTLPDPLFNHRRLCDELYQLALDENHFLKEQRRAPTPELIERKRALLARLEESLAALRAASRPGPVPAEVRTEAEKAKARILQFLHLDRENEQLILRHSLAFRPEAPAAALATAAHLQRAYQA